MPKPKPNLNLREGVVDLLDLEIVAWARGDAGEWVCRSRHQATCELSCYEVQRSSYVMLITMCYYMCYHVVRYSYKRHGLDKRVRSMMQ